MNYCYELPPDPHLPCCEELPRIEKYTKVLVKKGMAYKAFLKYCENNDLKNIQRQINAGIITVLP